MAAPAVTVNTPQVFPRMAITTMDLEDAGGGKLKFTRFAGVATKVTFIKDIEQGPSEGQGGDTNVFYATEMKMEDFHTMLDDDTGIEDIVFYCHGASNDPGYIFNSYLQMIALLPPSSKVVLVPVIWPTAEETFWTGLPVVGDTIVGDLTLYFADQENAEKSGPLFGQVLADYVVKYAPTSTRLHMICHSMGNRVLRYTTPAVRKRMVEVGMASGEEAAVAASANLVANIIMIAADITEKVFHREENPEATSDGRAISSLAKQVSVLYSATDTRLNQSGIINLDKRIGATGAAMDKISPEVTNVVNVNCKGWNELTENGHNYVERPETMNIVNLLLKGKPVPAELTTGV